MFGSPPFPVATTRSEFIQRLREDPVRTLNIFGDRVYNTNLELESFPQLRAAVRFATTPLINATPSEEGVLVPSDLDHSIPDSNLENARRLPLFARTLIQKAEIFVQNEVTGRHEVRF